MQIKYPTLIIMAAMWAIYEHYGHALILFIAILITITLVIEIKSSY